MFQTKTCTDRALLLLLCAFVLIAQLGAATHAVWHAARDLPAHEYAVLTSDSQQAPAAPDIAKLCVLDSAFAQVLGGAPTSDHAFVLQSVARDVASDIAYRFVLTHSLAPHSRGPPALL